MTPAIYPLRFKEILRAYTFGERWIPEAFPAKGPFPPEGRITETWEVCDRPSESGEIVNGPLASQTLRQAIDRLGANLLGTAVVERFGSTFPLLIKFLDVSNPLAEQAHHSDELVRRLGLRDHFGKTEAWHVVRARPGASVHCGMRPGVTREQFLEALLRSGTRDCMGRYECAPGDTFLLYAGTIHASLGGVLIYEIMQNSDVYAGLRISPKAGDSQARLEEARRIMEVVDFDNRAEPRSRPLSFADGVNTRTCLMACEHFAVERLDLIGDCALPKRPDRFRVLTVVEGEAILRCGDHGERLCAGQSCLLPAALPASVLSPCNRAAVLSAWVPDLAADIIEPWRARGFSDSEIALLGGQSSHNPLQSMLASR